MESPAVQTVNPDSPMEQDDVPFPCKGCGEILEEGKAFELAGNRWHIDCFRCSTCGTLLDSDAHLLLLGDGSLICSNCTYSCSSCGNKIEDLAILTGDQAFCAQCFRCRNCKKKIENLRYARTSQGIFCMECHESLMQRRRKKNRGVSQSKKTNSTNAKLDKSLPSLPPPDESGTASDEAVPEAYVEPATEMASRKPAGPRPQPGSDLSNTDGPSSRLSAGQESLILPSSTYRSNRHSMVPRDTDGDGGGEFLIPVAFDPSEEGGVSRPASHHTLHDQSRKSSRNESRQETPRHATPTESTSPHIAYQEKGRDRLDIDAGTWRQEEGAAIGKPHQHGGDYFHLQNVPGIGKSASARSSRSDLPLGMREISSFSPESPESSKSRDASSLDLQRPGAPEGAAAFAARPSHELRRLHENGSIDSARSTHGMPYLPKRGDSLEGSRLHQIPRREVGLSPQAPSSNHIEERNERSTPGADVPRDGMSPYRTGFNKTSGKLGESPRIRSNSNHVELSKAHARGNSLSTLQSDSQRLADYSPSLPRYSAGGDLSMDEDVARMMGSDDIHTVQNSESFLRRVSNSVRHGRSFSDKSARFPPKRPRTPNGSIIAQDITSPAAEPRSEEVAWLRNELRKERQRVSEREQKIAEMGALLRATADVKQVNTELHEKRSTMVVLDAQKEIAMRELSVLTDHLEAEKRGASGSLDLGKLTNTVLREFVESIQKLKDSYTPQVEELIQKRNETAEELTNLNRMKEKSFQEFEQLSSKNAQLAELNNQLVHQIQELYKASSQEGQRGPNGLGIYSHNKEKSMNSIENMKVASSETTPSVITSNLSEEAEPATIVPGTQVVSLRKGQPRKFNWKKGGQNVAKGVKGLKGAFMSSDSTPQDGGSGMPRSQSQDPSRQGFGFFGNQRNKQVGSKTLPQTDSVPAMADASPSGLFGTELEQRMEYEKSIIPAIVTRCIQEVELRGMDMEGIYRKSGASSAIQTIRDGFERSPSDFDISDPDLDIHAVTSALKQYFRKLPTPLITYDVYEKIIESCEITQQSARIEHLQKHLQELPQAHQDVLEFLMFHLKRVVEREKENLMTSQNVAVVFAPTIMRPESLAREMSDVQKKNEAMKFLVENCQEVFLGMQG